MECTPSYPAAGERENDESSTTFRASHFQTNPPYVSKTHPAVGFGIYVLSFLPMGLPFFGCFAGSQVSSKMSSALLAIGFCALAGMAILAEHVVFRTDGDMEIVANWLLD